MTRSSNRVSLVERRKATREGAQSLAAAKLGLQVARLLNMARDKAGLTNRDIASRLDLTEGRVSQVLNGDGNLHVASVGRFLRACGYELNLSAVPVEDGLTEIPDVKRAPIRLNEGWDAFEQRLSVPRIVHRASVGGRVDYNSPKGISVWFVNPVLRPPSSAPVPDHSLAHHYRVLFDVSTWLDQTHAAAEIEDPTEATAR